MCMFEQPKAPTLPPQQAAAQAPSRAQAQQAGQRTGDAIRSGTSTILTSPSGVLDLAETQKKTLLGQ